MSHALDKEEEPSRISSECKNKMSTHLVSQPAFAVVVVAMVVAAMVAARHAADFRSLLNTSYFW